MYKRQHYPAINWLTSYSEYIPDLTAWYETNVGPTFVQCRNEILNLLTMENRLNAVSYTHLSMRQKQEEEIKQQLLSEAETKITRQREHYEAAKRRLEEDFAQKKDSLAEKIFESIISP